MEPNEMRHPIWNRPAVSAIGTMLARYCTTEGVLCAAEIAAGALHEIYHMKGQERRDAINEFAGCLSINNCKVLREILDHDYRKPQ